MIRELLISTTRQTLCISLKFDKGLYYGFLILITQERACKASDLDLGMCCLIIPKNHQLHTTWTNIF